MNLWNYFYSRVSACPDPLPSSGYRITRWIPISPDTSWGNCSHCTAKPRNSWSIPSNTYPLLVSPFLWVSAFSTFFFFDFSYHLLKFAAFVCSLCFLLFVFWAVQVFRCKCHRFPNHLPHYQINSWLIHRPLLLRSFLFLHSYFYFLTIAVVAFCCIRLRVAADPPKRTTRHPRTATRSQMYYPYYLGFYSNLCQNYLQQHQVRKFIRICLF